MNFEDREILLQATELSFDERKAFVDDHLRAFPKRRDAVLKLLGAYESVGAVFLDPNEGNGQELDVAGYEILEILGQGSFGTVYLAEELGPIKRKVALKVLRLVDRRAHERFRAEGQYLAILEHPAIARIFAAGEASDGRPYFAMERINGDPVTIHADSQKWSFDRRVQAFMDICDGVAFAHGKGVIHADLKPNNILVERTDDRPRIIDFGVARTLSDRGAEALAQRSLLGTPSYMSPELARGHALDTRSDVYSLGVLLYELLTRTVPADQIKERDRTAFFVALSNTKTEIASDVFQDLTKLSPPLASKIAAKRQLSSKKLRRRLSGDMDAILGKALELDPNRRYPTVLALKEDLERSIARVPVTARARRLDYVIRQAVLRHRLALSACIFILIVAVSGWLASKKIEQSNEKAALSIRSAADWSQSAHGISDYFVSVVRGIGTREGGGQTQDAVGLLRSASDQLHCKFEHSPLVEAQVRKLLGNAFLRVDAPQDATNEFQRLIEIYRTIPGPESRGEQWRGRLSLTSAMISLAQDEMAQAELETLRQEFFEMGDLLRDSDRINLELNASLCALDLGDFDQATTCARKVLELTDEESDQAGEAISLARMVLAATIARQGEQPNVAAIFEDLRNAKFPPYLPADLVRYIEGKIDSRDDSQLGTPCDIENKKALFEKLCAANGRYSELARACALDLAESYLAASQLDDCEVLVREEHSWVIENWGGEDKRYVSSVINLAELALSRNDVTRAKKLIEQASQLSPVISDLTTQVKLHIMRAELAGFNGDEQLASDQYREALQAQAQIYGVDSIETRVIREELASSLVRQDRLKEALVEYDALFTQVKESGTQDRLELARLSLRLGLVEGRVGNAERADTMLAQAFEFAQDSQDETCLDIASTAASILMKVNAARGKTQEAQKWRERFQKLRD